MNIEEKIDVAVGMIEIINPDNIFEIESDEIMETLETDSGLNETYKYIKEDLVKNNLNLYYSAYDENYAPKTLEEYADSLSEWADNEFTDMEALAIDDPRSFGEQFYLIVRELIGNIDHYVETFVTIKGRLHGNIMSDTLNISIYNLEDHEDDLINTISIMETVGSELNYLIMDTDTAKKYQKRIAHAQKEDKPEEIIKILKEERIYDLLLEAEEISF